MQRVSWGILLVIGSFACKPSDKTDGSTTEASTSTSPEVGGTTSSSTLTTTNAGTLTDNQVQSGQIALITNPADILMKIDAAVQSTFAGNLTDDGTRTPVSFAPGQLAIGLSLQGNSVSDECATSALPRPAGSTSPNDEMPRHAPHFAAGRFYCLLRFNTYAPNSVQGAYYQNKAFLCDLNRQEALVEGEAHTAKLDFSNTTCYSDKFRELSFEDGVPPPFDVQVKLDRPSVIAPDKWDSSVTITLPADFGGQEIVVLSKTTDSGLSTAAKVGTNSYVLSYDVAGGVLRIDQHSLPNPSKPRDVNYAHYRIYAKGEIAPDFQFSSLQKFIGIDSFSSLNNNNSGARSVDISSFNMDFSAGGRGYAVQCLNNCLALTNFGANTSDTTCYRGDDGVNTCTSVLPLAPTADADLAFSLIPGAQGTANAGDELLAGGPLTFDTVSFAVVE